MGGVAGHAGVFSTAGDVALFAQALLDRLARNGRVDFPLKQETLELMTRPEQPTTALGGATMFTRMGRRRRVWRCGGLGGISIRRSRGRGSVFRR